MKPIVTTKMKAIEQYFNVVLFMLYKVVATLNGNERMIMLRVLDS